MLGKVRKTFDCSLCQITCYSPATFSDHMNGKAHKKKLETFDVPNGNFHCEICNIGATDQGGFDLHLAGKKHYKKAVQELAQERLRSLKMTEPGNSSMAVPEVSVEIEPDNSIIEPENSITVPEVSVNLEPQEKVTKSVKNETNVENQFSNNKLEVIYFHKISFNFSNFSCMFLNPNFFFPI